MCSWLGGKRETAAVTKINRRHVLFKWHLRGTLSPHAAYAPLSHRRIQWIQNHCKLYVRQNRIRGKWAVEFGGLGLNEGRLKDPNEWQRQPSLPTSQPPSFSLTGALCDPAMLQKVFVFLSLFSATSSLIFSSVKTNVSCGVQINREQKMGDGADGGCMHLCTTFTIRAEKTRRYRILGFRLLLLMVSNGSFAQQHCKETHLVAAAYCSRSEKCSVEEHRTGLGQQQGYWHYYYNLSFFSTF